MTAVSGSELLSNRGVSIWLDDLNQKMVVSGELENLVREKNISGVTTNPAIFALAISSDSEYQETISSLSAQGKNSSEIVEELIVKNVQLACDVLQQIYVASSGYDGRVSVEVEPELAHDPVATVARARELWEKIDRKNLMIKIPATEAGLPAITDTIASGISVNVTLIFGINRYRQVASAYLYGLEKAQLEGRRLQDIHSVASVFVSRFDTAVETASGERSLLDRVTTSVGVANSLLTHDASLGIWESERAGHLLSKGANRQRLLWASTGTKNPSLDPAFYAKELQLWGTINTLPRASFDYIYDNPGKLNDDRLVANAGEAAAVMHTLTSAGVDYHKLTGGLEEDGLLKFRESWQELISNIKRG